MPDRTSSQVGDAPHVEAPGQLVQRSPTGCEETAQQPALDSLFELPQEHDPRQERLGAICW
jgi:hypothetical protein